MHQFSLVTVGVLAIAPGIVSPLNTAAAARAHSTIRPGTPVPSHAPSPSPVPTPSPSPTPVKSSAKKPPAAGAVQGASSRGGSAVYGMIDNLAALSPAELNRHLDDIKSLGTSWVRYDIEWSNVQEAGAGQYDWSTYDRVAQAVGAHGLTSLAIIDYTPGWARRPECSDTAMCAPADPAAYAGFAAAVANRYKAYGIHAYEIWNEPNNVQFFRPAADPVLYTQMLRLAYAAIKGADPQAVVITGGTSPAGSHNGYLSPSDFVNAIYGAGARGYFDALGHHPYTWPYSPAYPNPYNAWGQLTTLHNIMSNNGDGSKKIWITEFGAPTGGPGSLAQSGMSTSEDKADHVTEALQAKILGDGITIANSYPWVGPFFWYSYIDDGTSQSTVENFFGLIRADGTRKPAYYTYKGAVTGR